ncbi:ssDNA binding domain [Bacillus phage vB_BcgM]|nr:ssDNA binding domain [Bacillus phage vB_BcgM]
MNFADIIAQEQKNLEQQGGGDHPKVVYPETKHQRLFFEKGQTEIMIQLLPSGDLVSPFFAHTRKIFLSAKTSKGKELNVNFTLDSQVNEGSLLENKIAEWTDKGMIPTPFGGQQKPKNIYLVNAVRVFPNPQNPQQLFQERDQNGNLVVRLFEMPQTAFKTILKNLQDPFLSGGRDLSFLDPNGAFPIKIAKPAKGQMEYPVTVYQTNLPALGQGWETQLENLPAHAVPTERLENGYQWVETFINIKDGKPQGQAQQQQQAPANPYGAPAQNPYGQAPAQGQNPYGQPANPYGQPANPYQAPAQNTYAPPAAPNYGQPANPYGQPANNGYQAPPAYQPPYQPPAEPNIQLPSGMNEPDPFDIGVSTDLSKNGGVGAPTTHVPAQPPAQVPANTVQQTAPQGQPNLADVSTNANGFPDIDAMIADELA